MHPDVSSLILKNAQRLTLLANWLLMARRVFWIVLARPDCFVADKTIYNEEEP